MIRIKYISHALTGAENGDAGTTTIGDCLFIENAHCTDYDWLVVYDDFPRIDVGTIKNETEPLQCPKEHTILVTAEPPSIKIYPKCFTNQFGHLLTATHPMHIPHPHHHLARGAFHWMANYPLDEVLEQRDYPKTKVLSTVCSSKQQTQTLHKKRYLLTKKISECIPEMDWYGRGVKPLHYKYEALSDYKYHIAVENYIAPHHWTDKISDPILGLCLTFYAGDPALSEALPADCYIPIPLDDPEQAAAIIKESIQNNEYEKRLPAIKEARRRIVTQYNFFHQVAALIHEQNNSQAKAENGQFLLRGRHHLRKTPLNILTEALECARYKIRAKFLGQV